jgi:hypothetical protein
MKSKNRLYIYCAWCFTFFLTLAGGLFGQRFLLILGALVHVGTTVIAWRLRPDKSRGIKDVIASARRYRPRDTDAGRWLEAPVAELDKSTIGKLLASRASRDPSLHVVVRRTPPPVSSDALYDAELDG